MSSALNDGQSNDATSHGGVALTPAPTRGHVTKPVSVAAARAKKPADRNAAERAAVRSAAAKKAAVTRAANAAKAAEVAAEGAAPAGETPVAAANPHVHANPHRSSARKSTASKPPASKSSAGKKSTSPTGSAGSIGSAGSGGKAAARVSVPARSSKAQAASVAPPSRATRPSSAAELVASAPLTASRELAEEHAPGEFSNDVDVETIERAPRRPSTEPGRDGAGEQLPTDQLGERAERPSRVSMTISSVVATLSKKRSAASVYASLAAPMPAATLERPITERPQVEAGAPEPKQVPAPRSEINEATVPRPAVTRKLGGAVLEIVGLVKRYGENTAVASIDLTVNAGSFYGIVGPNGAGKTTTLSMATGLLRPDAGSVSVLGLDVWTNPREAKRAIGVLPDRLRLFDRLTGAQLLYYSGMLRGLDNETVRARTADLAVAFGLEDALDRLVSDYSAGMTKKVALAAAMIHAPRLLVLDEPFESVDPVSAATVTEILQKFVAAGGTVVMSSHSMDLIERVCDGVAIIIQGRVLASGTIDEVRGGGTLEERFVELVGGPDAAEGLEWLHSFSD